MKAIYPLSLFPTGYDFFAWMAMQQAYGATEIVFDIRNPRTHKWSLKTTIERFQSILFPAPALAGLSCSIGTEGEQLAPFYQGDFVRLCSEGMKVHRLKSVLPPGNERYTVTLRKTERSPVRNSNDPAWREFAAEIGARVIEDYDVQPIHLHDRMALYAGAEMNFFVSQGPDMLCGLSEYPCMSFNCHLLNVRKLGIEVGGSPPWTLPQHHSIYEPDDLPVIRRHFEAWREAHETASGRVAA